MGKQPDDPNEAFHLSAFQRMVLINQFEMLKLLSPQGAEECDRKIKILQIGSTKHYKMLMPLADEMPEKECEEVFRILDMFRAIHGSAEKTEGLADDERLGLRFRGLDGNNEADQHAYASFLLLDEERYPELAEECGDRFINSHSPYCGCTGRCSPYEIAEEALRRLAHARLWGFTAMSGGYAYYSFLKAKECEAYTMRAEALAGYDDLFEIRVSCKAAMEAIAPFGVGVSADSIRGRKFADAIEPVGKHLMVVRDRSHVLAKKVLEEDCGAMQDALDQAEGKEIESERVIYTALSSFLTVISRQKNAGKKEILK